MERWVFGASRLVALVLLVISLVPTSPAAAQNTSIESTFTIDRIDAPSTPLVPDGLAQVITIHWTYAWHNPAVAASVSKLSPTGTLIWDPPTCLAGNDGIVISGSLTQSFPFQPEGSPVAPVDVNGTSTFHVSGTLKAPGETPISCTFTGKVSAVVSQGSLVPETGPATMDATVHVEYLGLLIADVPVTIQETGPGSELGYEMRIVNRGNSASSIRFELVGPTEPGWRPHLPAPVIIGSLQQGVGNNATAMFLVSTPAKDGWNNAEAAFQLKMTPVSTEDASLRGKEITVPVIARVRGCHGVCAGAPDTGPLVAFALLGSALVARRFGD